MVSQGDKPNSWRQQRYEHEVWAVEKNAQLIQRAERALRVVRATRAAAIGLAESPFTGATNVLQGVHVVMEGRRNLSGNSEDYEQSEAMNVD